MLIGNTFKPSNGYKRIPIKETTNGKWHGVEEHIIIWVKANGPVPKGMVIHHKDLDKNNNRLENLEVITQEYHNRIHRGFILKDGTWYVTCKVCKQLLKLNSINFYITKSGGPDHRTCRFCWGNKQ